MQLVTKLPLLYLTYRSPKPLRNSPISLRRLCPFNAQKNRLTYGFIYTRARYLRRNPESRSCARAVSPRLHRNPQGSASPLLGLSFRPARQWSRAARGRMGWTRHTPPHATSQFINALARYRLRNRFTGRARSVHEIRWFTRQKRPSQATGKFVYIYVRPRNKRAGKHLFSVKQLACVSAMANGKSMCLDGTRTQK